MVFAIVDGCQILCMAFPTVTYAYWLLSGDASQLQLLHANVQSCFSYPQRQVTEAIRTSGPLKIPNASQKIQMVVRMFSGCSGDPEAPEDLTADVAITLSAL